MNTESTKTKQKRITSTLSINMNMLAKLMGVERRDLFDDRDSEKLDYDRLYVLCQQIRKIAPWGLEAGTRCIFKDNNSLLDMIERNYDIDDICEMAIYVAEKLGEKYE